MPTSNELNNGFKIGDWEILPARGVFRFGEREERPSPIVLKVLLALARRDGDLAGSVRTLLEQLVAESDAAAEVIEEMAVFDVGEGRRPPLARTDVWN